MGGGGGDTTGGHGSVSNETSGSGGHESGGGEHSLRDLHLDDYYLVFAVLVVIMVVVSMFLEFIIHALSKFSARLKHKHVESIINCVYQELMVLGLISMLMVVLKEAGALSFRIGGEEFSTLVVEFVHLLLFLLGVLYIGLLGVALTILIKNNFESWKKLEARLTTSEVNMRMWIEDTAMSGVLNMLVHYRRYNTKSKLRYIEMRKRFIRLNDLPADFNFARYLRMCMREIVIRMLHIDKWMWGSLLAIVLLDTMRQGLIGGPREHTIMVFSLIVGYGGMLMFVYLRICCILLVFRELCARDTPMQNMNKDPSAENLSKTPRQEQSPPLRQFSLGEKLFLANKPCHVLKIMQIATWLEAFSLSMFLLTLNKDVTDGYPVYISWFVILISVVPPFVCVLVFIPRILPMYVLYCAIYGAETLPVSKHTLIEHTFKEVQKKSQTAGRNELHNKEVYLYDPEADEKVNASPDE